MFETGEIEHALDVRLFRSIEHRRGNRHAVTQIAAKLHQILVAQGFDSLVLAIDLLQQVLERPGIALAIDGIVGVDRLTDLEPEASAGPAQMGLENLADIHATRHTQRVEHDVRMGAVLEERHVLDRHDLRHHTLITVAACHLVAGLDLALHRDEDLDHLHHARRQLVASLQLLDLIEESLLEPLLAVVVLLPDGLDLGHQLVVWRGELPPLRTRIFFEHRTGDLGVLLEAFWSRNTLAVLEHLGQTAVDVAIEDRLFVVAVLREPLDLLTLDRERTFVLVDSVTIEHAHFDDGPLHARRHPQRGVAHVRSLLTED